MNPLRFLFVLDSLDLGGAERQAVLLAKELHRKHGAEVKVLALRGLNASNSKKPLAAELCNEFGIPWETSIMPGNSLWNGWERLALGIARSLRQSSPDVLLPYTSRPNFFCGLLWRLSGARACIWGQRDVGLYRPPRMWERLAVANTPWFIGNAGSSCQFLTDQMCVPSERVLVVNNGIELAPPRADRTEWRARLGVSQGTPCACMVANLTETKDHFTLLRAWAIVVDRETTAGMKVPVLILAGYPGGAAKKIDELCNVLAIDKYVRRIGQTDDVAGLLLSMDLCVHSAPSEGMPNGILEPMAYGLAVVASDVPGIREALGDEASAYLATPGDPFAFADRIVELITDVERRTAAGERNRERICSSFSVERLAVDTMAAVTAALKNPMPWSKLGWVVRMPGVVHTFVLTMVLSRGLLRRLLSACSRCCRIIPR